MARETPEPNQTQEPNKPPKIYVSKIGSIGVVDEAEFFARPDVKRQIAKMQNMKIEDGTLVFEDDKLK